MRRDGSSAARNSSQCAGRSIVPGRAIAACFNFRQAPRLHWNSKKRLASAILELLPRLKSPGDSTLSPHGQETTAMVITSAHISPIIALIAGILILVMPRLLNLVVAIYLICVGLIGLGALKWLHM
jgi:hypothetical protein